MLSKKHILAIIKIYSSKKPIYTPVFRRKSTKDDGRVFAVEGKSKKAKRRANPGKLRKATAKCKNGA
jgi:hypothetical protein